MGSSKKQTIGYHYKWAQHLLWCKAADALLEYRVGGATAWEGRLSGNTRLTINKPQLWGGEKGEGGFVGDVDILFGAADQAPNDYLASAFGPKQSGNRGVVTTVHRGGRNGAFVPNPKTVESKWERITADWKDDTVWYPEKAAVPLAGENGGELVTGVVVGDDGTNSTSGGGVWSDSPQTNVGFNEVVAAGDRYIAWGVFNPYFSMDGQNWQACAGTIGGTGGSREGVFFKGVLVISGSIEGIYVSHDKAASFSLLEYPAVPRSNWMAASDALILLASHYSDRFHTAATPAGPWTEGAEHGIEAGPGICLEQGNDLFMLGGMEAGGAVPRLVSTSGLSVTLEATPALPSSARFVSVAFGNGRWVALTDAGEVIFKHAGAWQLATSSPILAAEKVRFLGGRFYTLGPESMSSLDGDNWGAVELRIDGRDMAEGVTFDNRVYALVGMNPAHMVYESLTHPDMKGDPVGLVNDASFRTAADRFFAEGFGLCTEYDSDTETPEQFIQRVCDVVAANCSQSRVDGQYYLDLVRPVPADEIASLPVIHEDDFVDFVRQPTSPGEAINAVSVEWFDPVKKEDRTTSPIYRLAHIRAVGEVIPQTRTYREIAVETLALRNAKRDLNAASTPLQRFEWTLKGPLRTLRPGRPFRLQAPSEGIGEMICWLGTHAPGTHTDAKPRMVAIQDVFSMPDTTHVQPTPGDWVPPSTIPVPSPVQAVFEAPYVEIAATLPNSELQAVPEDVGYLASVAVRPSIGINYDLATAAIGEAVEVRGTFDWTPSALVVEAATAAATEFTLTGGSLLDRVVTGSWALWGAEMVRVDALDLETGAVTLGRGVADTVPIAHDAGDRLLFAGDWLGTDQREYAGGETVQARLLTRTSSATLPIDAALVLPLTFAQRQFRPYPPGAVTVDGVWPPAEFVSGTFSLAWTHRDRLLQADQLVEWTAASVGPEPGTTYQARFYDPADDSLLHATTAVADGPIDVAFAHEGPVRMVLVSIRDGLESWQAPTADFYYSTTDLRRATEDNEIRITESGETRIIEE